MSEGGDAQLPGLPKLFFAEADRVYAQESLERQPASVAAGAPAGPAGLAGPAADQPSVPPGPSQPGQPPLGYPFGPPGQPPAAPPGSSFGSRQPQPASAGRRGDQRRTRRTRSTRPPDRELRQRGLAALVIGALALAALLAFNGDLRRGVYLIGFSALIGAGAVVIGITALRKAKRTESFRPRGTVAGIVMGAFAMLLTIPMLAVYLAFPSQVQNYMSCMTQAQSTPTRQGCVNQFLNSVGGAKP